MTDDAVASPSLRIRWAWVVCGLLLVVMYLPMRRYSIPFNLPFELEPYRLLVAFVAAGWLLALLSDRTTRLRRSGIDGPVVLLVAAVLGSLAFNPARLGLYQAEATKVLTLFISLIVVFYLIVSVVRTRSEVDGALRLLVGAGAVLAVFVIVEARVGWTPFFQLERIFPFLDPLGGETLLQRGAKFRAFGSAEHPIAMGALLVLLVPPALALAVRRSGVWWGAVFVLVIGVVSTVSRTGVLMLLVAGLVILAARWSQSKRYIVLVLPVLAVIHFAVPGTIGALRTAFTPEGGLVAEQQTLADSKSSGGRVSDFGPSLQEFSRKPLFGYGLGTRIVTGPEPNARILDNQWLGSLLDTGLISVVALLWLFILFIRRMLRVARQIPGPEGFVPVGLAASAAAFATGMFTYDAFAFTQVTLVQFVLFALGCCFALAATEESTRVVHIRPRQLQPVPLTESR